ncbi:MAG TPA: response regulator [Opitutaceae bacterium]|nr:response regulator [Opitutaceae bacterium]
MKPVGDVLVIDDDLAVRLRVGDLLARSGEFSLREAVDGPEGLAAAFAAPPDLILLDIMMPGMTGYEVCAALRADPRTRELPVIVLSAAEESEAMLRALEAGADDFLRKPFFAPELRAKIRSITRLNRFRTLAAERDRFRWLLDHSHEPLVVADEKGALVYANAPARDIFDLGSANGQDVATAIGRHFRAEPADAWAAWRELRQPDGGKFAIFQPASPQVAARWFEVELHAFEGGISQTLLKFTNRSATVQRGLETFTFQQLISHKIRTPLNGLGPVLDFLAAGENTPADDATAGLLGLARESAARLEHTLTGILDYHAAMFGAHGAPPASHRKSLAEIFARAAESAGLDGRLEFHGPAGHAQHPELLELVLVELLENYRKFSAAAHAGVRIACEPASGGWSLTLFAPGPPLPPDIVAQLGRPYAQLERSFSGEVPGIGLGLATSRILMRSIGGDLVLSNCADTPGLVARLLLPREVLCPSTDDTRRPTA